MDEPAASRRAQNLLGALALAVTDAAERDARTATGRSGTDTAALMLLSTSLEGSTQEALNRPLGLSQPGGTRLVDRLEHEGLVRRSPGGDRRSFALVLTDKGRSAASEALEARLSACAGFIGALDADETTVLVGLLERLLTPLPRAPADGMRICRVCDPRACGNYDGLCPVTKAIDKLGR